MYRSLGLFIVLLFVSHATGNAENQAAIEEKSEKRTRQKTIAALPFTNLSQEKKYAPLAEAMGDMLVSFLGKAKGAVFVERRDLDKVLKEQEISLKLAHDDKDGARVGRMLGADFILTGSVTVLNGKLRINAHLFEVETLRTARSEKAEGKMDEIVRPVRELARKLGADFDLTLPDLKESEIDKSPVASLHFMRGLGFYYGKMPDHAIVEFMKTLALEPDHAQARYWNGRCYFESNEPGHAKIEFDRFLREYPNHELAREVKELAGRCATETQ